LSRRLVNTTSAYNKTDKSGRRSHICHAMSTLSPECVNNDNTPGQAYDSLYIALHYDPEPAQTPPFASDLRATN